jgi:hypothetical protein
MERVKLNFTYSNFGTGWLLYPLINVLGNNWIVTGIDVRGVLDTIVKIKIPAFGGIRTPVVQHVASHTSDCPILGSP